MPRGTSVHDIPPPKDDTWKVRLIETDIKGNIVS